MECLCGDHFGSRLRAAGFLEDSLGPFCAFTPCFVVACIAIAKASIKMDKDKMKRLGVLKRVQELIDAARAGGMSKMSAVFDESAESIDYQIEAIHTLCHSPHH